MSLSGGCLWTCDVLRRWCLAQSPYHNQIMNIPPPGPCATSEPQRHGRLLLPLLQQHASAAILRLLG